LIVIPSRHKRIASFARRKDQITSPTDQARVPHCFMESYPTVQARVQARGALRARGL
jgi:hypothetical protein